MLISWYGAPENDWFPWLKNELEKKGYDVAVPDFATMRTDLPDMEDMLKTLKVDKDTVVIGHSLGAVLGLRLAERQSFAKLILVSGWDFDDLTAEHRLFWPNKINHEKIKENVNEIVVIHSDNDPYITAAQAEEMCNKRLGGKFVLLHNAGHISKKSGNRTDLPEILPFL